MKTRTKVIKFGDISDSSGNQFSVVTTQALFAAQRRLTFAVGFKPTVTS
jgi:hypothetical protein